MKAGWEVKPLGEVCELKPPKKLAKVALSEEELVSFAGMSELGELQSDFKEADARPLSKVYSGYTYFADDDVLVAKITPCFENGKMGIAQNLTNGIGFGSSEFVPLRPNGKITSEFLFYYLLRDKFRVDGAKVMSGAVGHKRVPHDYFLELPTPIPPLEEQKRIVAVLDAAFEGLNRAKENAETNLQNARELFESYLADLFSGNLEGWEQCIVGDVLTLQRGFDITKKEQRAGTVPVVSSGGTKSFHNEAKCEAPGVVVGRKGSIGTVHFIEDDYWPHDTTLWVKDFKGNDERLVAYLLTGLRLIELDTGTANPSLNRNIVHPIPISWPFSLDQRKISETIFEFSNRCLGIEAEYATKLIDIADLRQSLLQKAFAGELT